MKPTEGRHVKGGVVLDYARMVQSNPTLPWSEHLLPEDLDRIKAFILPGSWYPIDFFQRIGLAVFKLVAMQNNAVLRAYGSSLASRLNRDHPGMIVKGNPGRTLEHYIQIQRSFYSFDAFKIEPQGPNHLIISIYSLPKEDGIKVYIEQISGTIEKLIFLSEGIQAVVKTAAAQSQGQVINTLDVFWTI